MKLHAMECGTMTYVSIVMPIMHQDCSNVYWECHLIQSRLTVLCVSFSAAGLLKDTVHGDPLFSIPLPSEYITDPELKSVQLCFEVHGQSGNHYNLISDKCTSVTALYSAGVVNTEMNVITKIGVRTQGTNGTCHSVKVDLDNCSASLDGAYVSKSTTTASVDGVRLYLEQAHLLKLYSNAHSPLTQVWPK